MVGDRRYEAYRETGLVLMTHRYYDPETGRFVTRDPIGYEGGVNLYGYVGNDPIGRIDPWGLASQSRWDKFKSGVGGFFHEFKDDIKKVGGFIGGVFTVAAGIEVFGNWNEGRINNECTRQIQLMINDWNPKNPENVDWDAYDRLIKLSGEGQLEAASDSGVGAQKLIYDLFKP